MTIKRVGMGPRMSKAVVHNGVVYISGQVPQQTLTQGFEAQVKEVLHLIDTILSSVGCSRASLLSVSVSLADVGDFDVLNAVWEDWIDPENKPARITVGATLTSPEFKVEIGAIAAAKDSSTYD
ncbi:enamine deaminase RidA (YjgF/YER057c/UK114 family) [Paenalcaligenes hominis]|uniref:Enamine deaminase RidA (YjgF/YER057c/UK114 family) n=1 Tax=Paenalcaligenes hominis TaxID=643674 RepID=A0ABX0WMY1_9BURK|nr:RidA family protein [Paenalcaligenes hominis]NJB64145.1 enamine deaminase RidA (YjgF/YER057c/UK114 family) [Paenalcaligenes hominis]